jgi:hypothetical protein
MATMNVISYEDERLGFFADQRKTVQKRYDRLKKQIKPDEPYLSERRQFLYDCSRELSFYNDIIEMLEDDVTSRRRVERLEKILNFYAIQYGTVRDQQKVIDKAKSEVAKEIFKKIDKFSYRYLNDVDYSGGDLIYDITELKKKYVID